MQNVSKQEYLKSQHKKIYNLFLQSKYDLVIEKSKKMLKEDPSQITFYNLLALSYRELGNINRAEAKITGIIPAKFIFKGIKDLFSS